MTINIGDIDYSKELAKVGKLVQKLQNETEIVTKVDSWFTEFKDYVEGNGLVLDEGWLKSSEKDGPCLLPLQSSNNAINLSFFSRFLLDLQVQQHRVLLPPHPVPLQPRGRQVQDQLPLRLRHHLRRKFPHPQGNNLTLRVHD